MNAIRTLPSPTLREALYSLAVAKEIPDAGVLDDVVRRFPQYGSELTEFAIAIVIDALRGDVDVGVAEGAVDPAAVSPAVSRAMSRFQNRLYAVNLGTKPAITPTERSTVSGPTNPIAALSRDEFRAFARRLNASNVFAMKLRDRKVLPNTLTPGFQKRVADELRAPLDVVVAHFAAGQSGGARAQQFFKADDKPTDSGQQTFEEAVRSSGLTDEQQRQLLGL
jgi:hypothetical protein